MNNPNNNPTSLPPPPSDHQLRDGEEGAEERDQPQAAAEDTSSSITDNFRNLSVGGGNVRFNCIIYTSNILSGVLSSSNCIKTDKHDTFLLLLTLQCFASIIFPYKIELFILSGGLMVK